MEEKIETINMQELIIFELSIRLRTTNEFAMKNWEKEFKIIFFYAFIKNIN